MAATPPPRWPGPPPPRAGNPHRKYAGLKIPKVQGFAIALLAYSLTDYSVFSPEITMAKVNLSEMTVEALMDLRKRVDETLHQRRAELEKQLERMGRAIDVVGGGGGSVLKGRKVPQLGQAVAKYLVGLLLRSKVGRNSTIS